jgi:hypothetical protein
MAQVGKGEIDFRNFRANPRFARRIVASVGVQRKRIFNIAVDSNKIYAIA